MSKCECKECVHEAVCQEVNNLKCRKNFVWYRAETGCPHFNDKSLFVEIPCRCEECIYFQCEKVLLSDGTYRDYTEEEIKNGKSVTIDVGINVGSQCMRIRQWERSGIPVWFNEKAYCSYGKKKLNEAGG